METDAGFGMYYPEYALAIGSPTQSFSHIASAWVAADGAYERSFTGGRVIVNPTTTTTRVIHLGRTYQRAVITGGASQHGGRLSFTPVTSVQLGPDQAAILAGATSSTSTTPTGGSVAALVPQVLNVESPRGLFSDTGPGGVLSISSSPGGNSGGVGVTFRGESTQTHGWISNEAQPWHAGTYRVKYSLFTRNPYLSVTKVEVLRLSSEGDIYVIGSQAENQNLGSVSTYTFSVPGTAQRASASDKLAVRFTVRNSSARTQKVYLDVGPRGASQITSP